MRRKTRKLTAEDRAVWAHVTRDATPLSGRRPPQQVDVADMPEEGPAAPPPPGPAPRPQPRRKVAPEPPIRISLVPDPAVSLPGRAPSMDAKAYGKLKRGKLSPEARIDLHGMTADRAHGALRGFILDASARGLRLVLVITGKGRAAPDSMTPHRKGVLRTAVPQWLSMAPLSPLVLEVAPAHQRHGGQGAYYVYLRRRK